MANRHAYPECGGGWRKYGDHPVLGGPELGTCFDVTVMEDRGRLRMDFSWRPKKSLAFCVSDDGAHWSAPEITLSPDPESGWEDGINRNSILKKDGVYHMWYTGQARGYSWIGYAVSDKGARFTRVSKQPVLFPERPFEGMSVMNPCVLWDADARLYRMWYSAGETYEPNVLGYATSPDGRNWTKLPANPIFGPDKAHPYEQARVGGCQVLKADGWYLLFYIGYEDIDTARICVARSRNGVTGWERLPANPIVSPTPGGWDEDACYKPHVCWDAARDRWMLWYNGRRKSDEAIGLALHEGRDLGFPAG